jgi:hypothetical protein
MVIQHSVKTEALVWLLGIGGPRSADRRAATRAAWIPSPLAREAAGRCRTAGKDAAAAASVREPAPSLRSDDRGLFHRLAASDLAHRDVARQLWSWAAP